MAASVTGSADAATTLVRTMEFIFQGKTFWLERFQFFELGGELLFSQNFLRHRVDHSCERRKLGIGGRFGVVLHGIRQGKARAAGRAACQRKAAPARSKTSGPHAALQHTAKDPVFIRRCGAARRVKLIPSVFAAFGCIFASLGLGYLALGLTPETSDRLCSSAAALSTNVARARNPRPRQPESGIRRGLVAGALRQALFRGPFLIFAVEHGVYRLCTSISAVTASFCLRGGSGARALAALARFEAPAGRRRLSTES